MEFIHNQAIDFICAVLHYALRNETAEKKTFLGLKGIEAVQEWIDITEKNISPFLESDIELLVKKIPQTSWLLIETVISNEGCSTAAGFLNILNSLTPEYIQTRIKSILNLPQDKVVSYENILAILPEISSSENSPEETARLISSFLTTPADFLERLKNLYKIFYSDFYSQTEVNNSEQIKSLFIWHKERFEQDEISYLNGATRDLFNNFFETEQGLNNIYFSFFLDTSSYLSTDMPMVIIGAGTKDILNNQSDNRKTDILFSVLGDSKRLEILRLVSIRPWFSNELATHFGITPATMSYHLNKMVSSRILSIKPGNSRRYYYIVNKQELATYLQAAGRELLNTVSV